jgi:hypothetical protein
MTVLPSEVDESSVAHLLGKPVRVVTQPALGLLREEIRPAQSDSQLLYLPTIDLNRGCPFRAIAGDYAFRQIPRVHEHVGDDRPDVVLQGQEVVRDGEVRRLPGWVIALAA